MSDTPLHLQNDRDDFLALLKKALGVASRYIEGLDTRPAGAANISDFVSDNLGAGLPEAGLGGTEALRLFEEDWLPRMSGSPGPRYFAFVTGGVTPAALAGDWLAGTIDQNTMLSGETVSPWLEEEALAMLRELLGLPADFVGNFVTGGTMANFTGLAVGRQAVARRFGVDVAETGIGGMPPIHVLSSAPHASAYKTMAMLGLGRRNLEAVPCRAGRESVDVAALEARLAELQNKPVIVIANAGTAPSGDFDDLAAIAELRARHDFWLHVDGAFGAFAAASPSHAHLVKGMEAADSIAVDAHKWLNVPYDSGIAFTRHAEEQIAVFKAAASYLAPPRPDPRNYLHMGPENSRRFRALPAWMSLKAYGREGYRSIVERCCALAGGLGELIGADDNFRLLAPVRLNIACFTVRKGTDWAAAEDIQVFLDTLRNEGTAFLSPGAFEGEAAIRAAFSNWRTTEDDMRQTFEALCRVRASLGW